MAKHFNNKSSENKTPSLQNFSKLLVQTPDMRTLMSDLKKEKEFDNIKLEDLQKDLEKKEPCIVCDEETTDYYKAKCSYVTKSLLSELKKIKYLSDQATAISENVFLPITGRGVQWTL